MPTVVRKSEIAEAPAERDRVVDGTAAEVEHHGRAAELASAGKLLEIPGRISGDDADRADPAAAVRFAGDPAELHRQLALFEGGAGIGPTSRSSRRRQPTRHHKQRFPPATSREGRATFRSLKLVPSPSPKRSPSSHSVKPRSDVPSVCSHMNVTKMVSGGIQIVHRYLLHCSQKARKIWRTNNSLQFPASEPRKTSPTISAQRP